MTIAVDLGRKATKTYKQNIFTVVIWGGKSSILWSENVILDIGNEFMVFELSDGAFPLSLLLVFSLCSQKVLVANLKTV